MARRKEKERTRTKIGARTPRSVQEGSSKNHRVDAEAEAVIVRDQSTLSLGFLQSAENFEINDGSIANIGGDSFNARRDMNVTINLSPVSSSSECSSVNANVTPLDIVDENKREQLREPEPERSGGTPSTSASAQSSSGSSSRCCCGRRHEHGDVYPEQTRTLMLPHLPIQRSCDIYRRHLVTKGRGIPLWIPEPSKNLPIQYQRKGVSIGDVGIITASGSFLFLFNIYLPKDHPINPPVMPKGFEPLRRGGEIMGMPEMVGYNTCPQKEFKKNSYVASELSVKTRKDGDLTGLIFESSEQDGAILAMPDGANSEDLVNTARLWKYVNKNLKSWYQYAYRDREIEVGNGDLKVVCGCDKTSAWGMATFFNSGAACSGPGSSSSSRRHSDSLLGGGGEPKFHLKFGLIEHGEGRTGEGRAKRYGWECSGMADVRAGPDDSEVLELRGGEEEEEGVVYDNQCLFVRTLNLTFPTRVWEELGFEEEEEEGGFHENSTSGDGRSRASSSSSSSSGRGGNVSGGSSAATFSSSSASKTHMSASSSINRKEIVANDYNAGSVYSSLMSLAHHPSIAINDLLLKNCSDDITMAITLDQHWMSVLREDDFVLPSSDELLKRIMDTYTILEEDDVVFLQSKCVVEGQRGFSSFAVPSVGDGKLGQIIHDSSRSSRACPSQAVTEQYPRKTMGITEPLPLNLYSLPNINSLPSYGSSTTCSSGYSVGSSGNPGGMTHDSSSSSRARPSHADTEQYLRKTMGITEPLPLNLYSLPDNPDGSKKPSVADLARLAIWGSRDKRLTLQQIYEAIEERYPSWKASKDKPWRRSIRHNLSFKAIFENEERPNDHPGKGRYWVLNVSHGEATKRPRVSKDVAQSGLQGYGSEFTEDKSTPPSPALGSQAPQGY